MSFRERLDAWFPGATGESEGEEAERLARELQSLRESRANVALFAEAEGRNPRDAKRVEQLNQQIAATVARLKALGIEVPPELSS
jgi:hypothetical protein